MCESKFPHFPHCEVQPKLILTLSHFAHYKQRNGGQCENSRNFLPLRFYRPGQLNWENTMWKCQDFAHIHNVHENDFGHFEVSKTAVFTI